MIFEYLNTSIRFLDAITLLSIHFLGNYLFQNSWQASNKSVSIRALSSHVANYCLTMLLLLSCIYYDQGPLRIITFVAITFPIHWIQDFITSRIGYRLKIKAIRTKNWKPFYLNRGFDHLLHYIQLFTTFYFIFK